MQADYTVELKKIANALSHQPPSWQPWLLAAFSVFLGIIGGAIGRIAEPWFVDMNRRYRMRRVIYTSITHIYSEIQAVLEYFPTVYSRENGLFQMQEEQIKRVLTFEDENYFNGNVDVFRQLPEHGAVRQIYSECHRILAEMDKGYNVNCSRLLWWISLLVMEGRLEPQYFRKFVPGRADAFLADAKKRQDETNAAIARIPSEEASIGEGNAPES